MKRSWLIGTALVFSLSAAACGGDDDGTVTTGDGGKPDSGATVIRDGGIDGGGLDSGFIHSSDGGDAG